MKWFIAVFLFVTMQIHIWAQEYNGVTLLGHLDKRHGQFGDGFYSDIWGYTADDGKEYALLLTVDGTAFIDISDPTNPYEVDFIPASAHHNRDIKTYSHYAYIISERSIGLQIVDLSFLPDSVHLVKHWTYEDFNHGHNLFQDDSLLYIVGGNATKHGGILIVSLKDPVNPKKIEEWDDHYVHDVYVRGDTIYAAGILGDGVSIIDAGHIKGPQLIAQIKYEMAGTHNAWLTEDGNYVLTTDEISHPRKGVKIWDIHDLNNITLIGEYFVEDAVVHNVYVRGNYAHLAYYKEGYIVLDISDPINPIKVGHYDTYPSDEKVFGGVWGAYPFFPSGNIIVSDRQTGLYIFSFTPPIVERTDTLLLYQNYPNPFNQSTIIRYTIPEDAHVKIEVYNILGQYIDTLVDRYQNKGWYAVRFSGERLASGVYVYIFHAGNRRFAKKMTLVKSGEEMIPREK